LKEVLGETASKASLQLFPFIVFNHLLTKIFPINNRKCLFLFEEIDKFMYNQMQ
jgi:hypothetical protein